MTAPVSIPSLYFGKLATIFRVTLMTQLWMGILYFICGKLIGFSGIFPSEIVFWLLRGTLAATAIGALQLLLSMVIRSFSVPIGIALVGSVLGILISNKGLELYWPYSLMLMGMNSNKSSDTLAGNSLPFIMATLVYFLIFYSIAVWLLKSRDVRA